MKTERQMKRRTEALKAPRAELRLDWPLLEQQWYCRSQPAQRSTPYSETER